MVIDTFDHLLHGRPQEAQQIITQYTGHQPSHHNSLPALLKIPKANSQPYFDVLREKEIIARTIHLRAPQVAYHAGSEHDGLVIGKHGHTLLFSEKILDVFPKQTHLF